MTYTNAATLYIANAPAAGSHVTLTNPYALDVAAGNAYFGGNVGIGAAPGNTLDVNGGATVRTSLTVGGTNGAGQIVNNGQFNWNYPNLDLIRTSSNTSSGRMIAFLLGADADSDATDNDYFKISLDNNATLTSSSTSSANTKLRFNGPGPILLMQTGNVGIGNSSPSYTLQVNGSVAGTSAYVNTSDIRFKKNVQPLDVGLNLVTQMRPVSFEWDVGAIKEWKYHSLSAKERALRGADREDHPADPAMQGKQIGFIAQDMEKILPSVVVTEANAEKTKGMKYSELIPVLVKAIQEQQAQLSKDEATIAAMKVKLGM